MQGSKINLLVVDDNTEFCNIINSYMSSQEDINITGIAKDGKSALEYIKHHTPDLLLLDMIMPRLDGLGVLEVLAAMNVNPMPKVIILSAVGNDALIQRAMSLGADYYIVKPFDFSVLLSRIREMFQSETREVPQKRTLVSTEINPVRSETSNLEVQITELICKIGIPAHISGYKYIREAISIYIDQKGMIAITKDLYPQIARKYNTAPNKVERAIRHAIEVAFSRGKTSALDSVYNATIDISKTKPTNFEFIASLAEILRLKNKVS